tara:strand:- start:928 stop:1125 length:198 start_codon:yes stop_codon:yes gene_type:complete
VLFECPHRLRLTLRQAKTALRHDVRDGELLLRVQPLLIVLAPALALVLVLVLVFCSVKLHPCLCS